MQKVLNLPLQLLYVNPELPVPSSGTEMKILFLQFHIVIDDDSLIISKWFELNAFSYKSPSPFIHTNKDYQNDAFEGYSILLHC